MDPPHLSFTVTRCLRSVRTLSVKEIYYETKTSTFQFNRTVVSKLSELSWLEHELNLSYAYFEKRPLDCQCGTGVGSNVTIHNQSVSEKDDTKPKVNERVEIPMNGVAFLEFARLQFDTCFVLEDELKVGPRTSLDKIDSYIYKTT